MLSELKLKLQNYVCLAHKHFVISDVYQDAQIHTCYDSSLFLLLLFPAVPVLPRGQAV